MTMDSEEYELMKNSMRKMHESLHSQASSMLVFTLQWKELEERLDSIRDETETRLEELHEQEKQLDAKELKVESKANEIQEQEDKLKKSREELDLIERKIKEQGVEFDLKVQQIKVKEEKLNRIGKCVIARLRLELKEQKRASDLKEKQNKEREGILNRMQMSIEEEKKLAIEEQKKALDLKQECVKEEQKLREERQKEEEKKSVQEGSKTREELLRKVEQKMKDNSLRKKAMEEWSFSLERKERELELKEKHVLAKEEELDLLNKKTLSEFQLMEKQLRSLENAIEEREKKLEADSQRLQMKEKELESKVEAMEKLHLEREKQLEAKEWQVEEKAKELELTKKQSEPLKTLTAAATVPAVPPNEIVAIQNFLTEKKLILAYGRIVKFKLFDKFPPAQVLKEYAEKAMKCMENSERNDQVILEAIADLQQAKECIQHNNLESQYPSESIEKQIVALQKFMEHRRNQNQNKRLSSTIDPNFQQQHVHKYQRTSERPCVFPPDCPNRGSSFGQFRLPPPANYHPVQFSMPHNDANYHRLPSIYPYTAPPSGYGHPWYGLPR